MWSTTERVIIFVFLKYMYITLLFYIKRSCLLSSLVLYDITECKRQFEWVTKVLLQSNSMKEFHALQCLCRKWVIVSEYSMSLCIYKDKMRNQACTISLSVSTLLVISSNALTVSCNESDSVFSFFFIYTYNTFSYFSYCIYFMQPRNMTLCKFDRTFFRSRQLQTGPWAAL